MIAQVHAYLPRGQMEMIGEARRLMEAGEARHYWLKADDEQHKVALHPYSPGET